jgi:hypothetical protein
VPKQPTSLSQSHSQQSLSEDQSRLSWLSPHGSSEALSRRVSIPNRENFNNLLEIHSKVSGPRDLSKGIKPEAHRPAQIRTQVDELNHRGAGTDNGGNLKTPGSAARRDATFLNTLKHSAVMRRISAPDLSLLTPSEVQRIQAVQQQHVTTTSTQVAPQNSQHAFSFLQPSTGPVSAVTAGSLHPPHLLSQQQQQQQHRFALQGISQNRSIPINMHLYGTDNGENGNNLRQSDLTTSVSNQGPVSYNQHDVYSNGQGPNRLDSSAYGGSEPRIPGRTHEMQLPNDRTAYSQY